jgi:hypothetical protein
MTERVYGHTRSGEPITDAMIYALADEAELNDGLRCDCRARYGPGCESTHRAIAACPRAAECTARKLRSEQLRDLTRLSQELEGRYS